MSDTATSGANTSSNANTDANTNAGKPNANHQNGKNGKNRNRNRNRNAKKASGPTASPSTSTSTFPTKPGPGEQKQKEHPKLIAEEEDDDDAPEHHHCLICYSSHLHQERGITPCRHDSVCASCHLRLRSLLDDKKCPICKATNHRIIVDADTDPLIDHHKSFEDYEKWGDDIGPNHTFREDVGMFFPTVYYHTKVTPLFALSCNVPRCQFANDSSESNSPGTRKSLTNHLAAQHNPPLQICDLCITFKRDFISRLPRFSANQLKEHNKHGDEGAGRKASGSGKANKGHPLCQFCQPRRFYDLTELHKHLNKEHYECFVCKKMETPLQFFKDYNKLNLHFDREHYLCRFPECLASRFVVFPNEIDLKAHERDIHGLMSGGSTKIQMEFRVRASGRDGSGVPQVQQQVPSEEDFGFGLDGGVFVPESLDDAGNTDDRQNNEPEISHGPHAQRTALLREHARLKREEMGVTGESGGMVSSEAFPSLGSQGAGNLISWSREGGQSTVAAIRGRNTTALNESNFPSLGGPSETKTNNMTSKLRATKSANGQFSAMTRAANASASTSRPFANAALTSGYGGAGMKAKANLSADNFPSLGGAARGSGMGSIGYGGASMKAKANLSADNFPSLGRAAPSSGMGMGGSNNYAAAQAYAKKNNSRSAGVNFDLDQHFPAPSMSGSAKSATKKSSVFQKKPAAQVATNNFLAFPPPPSSNNANGTNQVEGMKQALGQAKYKHLKKSTKEFVAGSLDPESYITSVVSLFDNGVEDPSLWEFIPNLISSCPNESKTKRALRYLESMRYSLGQTAPSEPAANSARQGASSGWASTAASAGSVLASTKPVVAPLQYGRAAAYATSISTKQNLSTGFTGRSLPVTQVKKKTLWNGSNSGVAANAGSVLAAAGKPPQNGTATKFMAKEKAEQRKAKHAESLIKQGAGTGKKNKSKAKKNELRDLAFGKS